MQERIVRLASKARQGFLTPFRDVIRQPKSLSGLRKTATRSVTARSPHIGSHGRRDFIYAREEVRGHPASSKSLCEIRYAEAGLCQHKEQGPLLKG